MYDLPQLDARGYYEEVEHPITGPHRYPTLGQHNVEVLRELGLTDDEIEVLRTHHVIGETALKA
jgi:crotonobetainyl-CoA:carnitine CoA-transferase CaiB-like acyl-CoA transferase